MALDRMKAAMAAVLEAMVGARLDYLARYPARVVSQDGNRLELQPDDPRIPGIPGVPIRVGVPGLTLKVPSGARVLLAFEGGDPSRPVAEIWESGTPIEVKFDAEKTMSFSAKEITLSADKIMLGDGAFQGVARLGDATVSGGNITSSSMKVFAL